MRTLPVAAARPSLFKALLLLFCLCALPLQAQTARVQLASESEDSYLAKIELHTVEELAVTLERAERLAQQSPLNKPIAFVLHGEEAKVLLRDTTMNLELQALARRLSDSNVIDVQVCRSWMLFNGYKQDEFADFVSTVPYAPSEIERLLTQENYTYF